MTPDCPAILFPGLSGGCSFSRVGVTQCLILFPFSLGRHPCVGPVSAC